ncbi:MAG: lipid-A-disaccharide synthase [Hyphomicrobium sp.]|jgi:lipid-A-disaccharide synthase
MSLTDRISASRTAVRGRDDLRIFLVAGEHSGDALGGKLMHALSARSKGRIHYLGVGGENMERAGLASQFPLSDVAVMGPLSILARLPRLVSRVYRTVDAAIAAEPDAVVIIDAPEFTHPIAKRIRRRAPAIPIIDYVSPSVWAWRPGRARKMRPYVDHVMGLLPFEPAAHERLGGPPCTYVGHPLVEQLQWMHELDPAPLAERLGLDPGRLVLVVLPGSRTSEVSRLMQPFGEALEVLHARRVRPQVIIPVVAHVRPLVERLAQAWTVKPFIVEGHADKFSAFRLAHAALAASGTVTLELALAGTPMVVAYKVDGVAAHMRFLLNVPSVVLANLVLEENAFPELLQEDCVPEKLADAVELLLRETPQRRAQVAALARIPHKMLIDGPSPSDAAADIVLDYALHGRRAAS